jgi:hypothetical protein
MRTHASSVSRVPVSHALFFVATKAVGKAAMMRARKR